MEKYPYQNLPGLNNVEVEGGETITLPSGKTYQFVGKSHPKGGIDVSVPEGSFIMSQKLKLPKDIVKTIIDVEKSMSPAQLSKRYDTNSYADKLSMTGKRYDELDKKTQEIMLLKNRMMQGNIFNAQEEFKNEKANTKKNNSRRKNANTADFSNSTSGNGSTSDGVLDYAQDGMFYQMPSNIPNYSGSALYPESYTGDPQALVENIGARLPAVQNNLLDPKYANQTLTGTDLENYKNYQRFLTGDKSVFDMYGLDNSKAAGVKRLTAVNWLRNQGTDSPDKNITGKALVNGKWEPLTKENINSATDYEFPGFVDGKPGNGIPGTDYAKTSNQPHIFYENLGPERTGVSYDYGQEIGSETEFLPKREFIPLKSDLKEPTFNKSLSNNTPKEELSGPDWQRIVNGVELGMNALQLANVKVKNPYYQYQPSQLYYTRFEPVNTKQQERAYNIARESIENSNLPELVKKARLADMYAKTVEGINQIDITNAQGNLQNKNQNVQYARQVMENDTQRRNQANYAYVQEQDRGQENAYNMRQRLLENSLGIWKDHIKNREEVDLVNQNFRNFKYTQQGNKVNYIPGQGNLLDFDKLSSYRQFNSQLNLPSGFDINDLSATGREKLLNRQ